MATKYDAIVIGTGQAGPSLAVRLAGTGINVAIIERKPFGAPVSITAASHRCIAASAVKSPLWREGRD
jgi:pyruvate/2-oxoglutarate dehydrogenase complex dihydrolipoamide dehydrogenase (E3) component